MMISSKHNSLHQIKRLLLRSSSSYHVQNYHTKAIGTNLTSYNNQYRSSLRHNILPSNLKYLSTTDYGFDDDEINTNEEIDPNNSKYKSYQKELEDEVLKRKIDDDPLYELKREILQEQRALGKKGQEILKTRKGRLFEDDWEITDDDIMAGPAKFLNTPDWEPSVVSTTALEKVHVLDELPTIEELANAADDVYNVLPEGVPHPSYNKEVYVATKKQREYDRIYKIVSSIAKDRVYKILEMGDVQQQQNAIDELFEQVENEVMEMEGMRLGNKKLFCEIVEKALEGYLDFVNEEERRKWEEKIIAKEGNHESKEVDVTDDAISKTIPSNKAVFINLKPNDKYFSHTGFGGKMQEDFDLSASNETNQNVLLRSITKQVAKCIVENKTHVYLHGRNGVGKSVCMSTIVACVRHDPKYICLYLPNGDKIWQHFDYLEPSLKREKYYDLPSLCRQACEQMVAIHGHQLDTLEVSSDAHKELLKECFSEEQLEELKYLNQEKLTLQQITQNATENELVAAQCYTYVVKYLTHHQKSYRFLIAVDEYNMYHWKSQYYHETFDYDVRYPIPFYRMNLLEPFINPLKHDFKDENVTIFTSVSYSRPVSNERTSKLTETTQQTKKNVTVLEVPRYSKEEHEAIVAHYECVGLGKLRMDKGKVLNDSHEMNFLYMLSGGIGRNLLDACIM